MATASPGPFAIRSSTAPRKQLTSRFILRMRFDKMDTYYSNYGTNGIRVARTYP